MSYFLALIGLSLGAAQAADEPPPSRELAPGVYALQSSDRFGSANLGWVVFADAPGWSTIGGAALIVASGLYILHRELKRAAQRRKQ